MQVVINTRIIGLGEYQISADEPNVITARYITSGAMIQSDAGAAGTGRAVGNTSDGFPGEYRVQYFDSKGKFTGDLDLHIHQVGGSYLLTWRHRPENIKLPAMPGEVVFEGMGFTTGERTMALTYWMAEKVSSEIEMRSRF